MATMALARMYGHDPPPLETPGWLLLLGTIGATGRLQAVSSRCRAGDGLAARFLWGAPDDLP